ncbi:MULTISPECIES: Dyp-type peroxidase [Pseudoalteromonas]|uniref:Iron-dependent peroxidase n=1 Tax=Pseudoalteromonas aurantia 208 TaxID=1314867 RepID=A0ABR9EEP2_9GAMM|nr:MULTISPECIES: Dyp-type peroxidase [Pseudoalteromonas]MBE0369446.1 putative iron-dependent peroxidase [Pseudoalteromonas aurantia 208]MBQ4843985.1 Dyp-type peroxidase [Pseudoalteromonas sp. MMG005]MBQ4851534.1 Dyp-type peroxidase [Pseudoalteromonas sp. MMG012]
MAQAQSGVCAEANLHGLHLFFNVLDGHDEAVRATLAHCERLQNELSDRFSESMVSSFVAIGAQYWPHIYPEYIPPELKSFPHVSSAEHLMHSQPFDLMYVIRSDREDVNHLFAQSVLHMLAPSVELVANVRGFRFLDGRDFNGFIYGGNAPHGRFKRQVALVDNPQHDDNQGSYVHVQRVKFDIDTWQILTLDEQEQVMGRTRLDNTLISPQKENSHATLAELVNEDGLATLLDQSMPFGDVFEQGSLWVSCSAHGQAFEDVLMSRLGTPDKYDLWLDYNQADMGAAFFAPSVQFLSTMAQSCEE